MSLFSTLHLFLNLKVEVFSLVLKLLLELFVAFSLSVKPGISTHPQKEPL